MSFCNIVDATNVLKPSLVRWTVNLNIENPRARFWDPELRAVIHPLFLR